MKGKEGTRLARKIVEKVDGLGPLIAWSLRVSFRGQKKNSSRAL